MDIGKRTTFWDFVRKTNTILIPEIQRDYVQGRETPIIDDIRTDFLDDLHSSLLNETPLDLNFVYGKNTVDGKYIPIDGQQRLTTLFLLHLFAFSKEKKTDQLRILKSKLTYETRTSTKDFIIELSDKLRNFTFDSDIKDYIVDSEWYFSEWNYDPSIRAMLIMLRDIYNVFNTFQDLSDKLTTNCPVSFMILDIKDIGKENDLYIKMNSRGRPLTSFECFKSELFDYINKQSLLVDIVGDFKKKIDDDWLNLFWGDFDLKKQSDKAFMEIIHYLLFDNYICDNDLKKPDDDQLLSKIDDNEKQSVFSFNNYKPLINDDSLRIVNGVFDLLLSLRNTYYFSIIKEDILMPFIDDSDNKNRRYVNRVCLMGIATYARQTSFDLGSFEEWYRIVRNLAVSHGYIDDPKSFSSAIKTVYSNYNNCVSPNCANKDITINGSGVPFFFKKNVECEILKAKIIQRDSSWLPVIREVEENNYLHSSIAFMFWLQDIDIDNIDSKSPNLRDFKDDYETFRLFVDTKGLVVDDALLRRGLLTYGDYSFAAQSSMTFSFEGGKRYFDFLRLLNEPNSFNVFKRLFNDFKYEYLFVTGGINLGSFLEKKIQDYSDQTDEFIYWLIKEPELLGYSKQNRYFKIHDGLYVLLSKNYFSAEYKEFYTFLLSIQLIKQSHTISYKAGRGQPNASDESRCYINTIDNRPIHIELITNQNEIVLAAPDGSPLEPRTTIHSLSDLHSFLSRELGINI